MTTAHVYFADVPLSSPSSSSATSVAAPEGHRSTFEPLNNDAIMQRQCSHQTGRDRSTSPSSNATTMPSTPRYERNMGFFRQLSRRFGLRSSDDLVYSGSNEEDNQSSSTDSCSSHRENANKEGQHNHHQHHHQQQQQQQQHLSSNASNIMTASMMTMSITEHISCASSETSSSVDIEEQQQQQQQQQKEQQVSSDEQECSPNGKPQQSGFHKDRKSFGRSSFSRLSRRSSTSIRRAFEAFSLSSRSLSCSGSTPPQLPPAPSLANPPHMHTSSATNSSGGTPIKSALKSSSNLELNKKSSSLSSSSTAATANAGASTNTTTGSCCSASKTSKTKTKPPPQRILRQPVSYTYLKGISGLPTQRVPRSSVCCQYARR
uniref:DUF4797 domain-containing protein n=1 Tax=Stomoxys calcitrans TaxID=35570 RepID=A0A1I8PQ41_STOCA